MVVTINGIPVYDALVTDDECGMNRISLVDAPAVEADFLAFAKDKHPQMYSVTDEEKRIVRGVVMRADFPIYRRDNRGEYYVIYKADTIRKMAEKYLLESKQNEVNLDHQDDAEVDGVQMVQWFIKDTEAGVNPAGFEDIAEGSLFAEFHVVNDEVWASIKDGTYKGFSLEGVFDMQPEQDKAEVESIVESLDGIFTKLYKDNKMSKLQRFKEALSKIMMECGNVTTDKGILYWESEDDLKQGDEVFVEDAEGNKVAAEDGDYTTEDSKIVVVVDGKVAEIKDAEAEVAPEQPAEQPTEEANVQAAEEQPASEEAPAEQPAEEQPAEKDTEARLADLEKIVEAICEYLGIIKLEKQEKLPEQMEAIKREIAELKAQPMAKPAHEEVVASAQVKETGVRGLDRLARIMKA